MGGATPVTGAWHSDTPSRRHWGGTLGAVSWIDPCGGMSRMPDFASKPYDGRHAFTWDPGDDWRNKKGLAGALERVTSYGNYGGFGNRNQVQGGYHAPI